MRKRILSLFLVVYMVLPCLFLGACTQPTESNPPVTEWYTTSKYNPNDYAFSFMVVGDTQVVSRRSIQALADGTVTNGNTYMDMIYDYIVDNVQKKKVKHVIGLGDITDYNSKSEWLEAQRVISKMNGIVPYSLTPGNHDGSTKWFAYSVLKNIPGEKTLFLYDLLDGTEGTVDSDEGVDLYKADKCFETFFSVDGPYANQFAYCYDNKPNNTIHLFSGADNLKYMVVALDYGATDEALAWASDIIKQYPKRNVIVTTHGYMWADGRYITSADGGMAQTSGMNGSRANNGDKLWEKFVSQHKNITMLICGHVDHDVIVYRQDKGVNGNMVTQMLCDPQGIDVKNVGQPLIQKYGDSIYNRLVGMVATYYVSADGKTIDVEWYSPIQKAYYTERGQFTFTTDVVAN